MGQELKLSSSYISLDDIFEYFKTDFKIALSEEAILKVEKNRNYLEVKLNSSEQLIYGINTGFGSLCDVKISEDQIEMLQEKLILSHACGTGDLVPPSIARLIQLLKIKNLSFGFSGVRIKLLETMIVHYNAKITPVIYQLGSLGASGDLAPLAHMSLVLFGKGEVYNNGNKIHSAKALEENNIKPIKLSAKEGIALINGTQFSLAYGIHAVYHAKRLMTLANRIAAMSIEAFNGMADPYSELLHNIRLQRGQSKVAAEIRGQLEGSEIIPSENIKYRIHILLDVYLKYMGQPVMQSINVSNIVELELNSVTDNPNIFDEEDQILSGGNFHAQPLALALDFLSIALSELADISERRIFKLIDGDRELPDFLTSLPGLNSGFMIVQYTAASVVNQNKHLANPVSTDSIVSSRGQEDHVSMAANAATKLYRLVDNVYRVLSMELMAAAQALEFRRPKKAGTKVENFHNDFRKVVTRLEEDREMYIDMDKAFKFCKNYKL